MVVGGTRCRGWGAGVGATFRMCSTFTVSPITARCLRGPRVRAGQCPPPTCRPPTPPPPTKPDMPPPADEVPQPGSQAAVEEPRVEGLLQRRRCLHGVPARGNGHGSHQPRCVSHPRQVVQHLHPAGEGAGIGGGSPVPPPGFPPPPLVPYPPRDTPAASSGACGYRLWMCVMAVSRSSVLLAQKVLGVWGRQSRLEPRSAQLWGRDPGEGLGEGVGGISPAAPRHGNPGC